MSFDDALIALREGRSVRLPNWESITRMYVDNGQLLHQRGEGKPYAFPLDWSDMQSTDWAFTDAAKVA